MKPPSRTECAPPRPLVTVLSGAGGAGKTTLLQHVLENSRGLRVAVIINDTADNDNLAPQLAQAGYPQPGDAQVSRIEERLVRMSSGCICCTLRDDLLVEISRLAKEERFDHLLIESSGTSTPEPIAQTFSFEDEDGVRLDEQAQLDTLVTVVDASCFLEQCFRADSLAGSGDRLDIQDEQTVSDLLVEQIEFADVIVLNKLDLITAAKAQEVEAAVRALNPCAKLHHAVHGRVPPSAVLGTGLFNYERTERSAGWLRELRGEPAPQKHGVRGFVYRTPEPFDADRLWSFLNASENFSGVLRSKGVFWLAAEHRIMYQWGQAGGASSVTPAGMWWAAVPGEYWEHPDGERPDQQPDWHPRFGDRAQELVFIGQQLDETHLRQQLDACLLDPDLAKSDSSVWEALSNPFPAPEQEADPV